MPILALNGVRVIEFATGIAGPFCGKLLADYGAEVIKIEPPSTGDPSRSQGPFPDETPHIEKSALFLHLNTNKQSVTLDIENVGARELLKRLLAESDIVIESFKPGKLESLRLGFDALKELRPNIVMTSITPFGQTGPHKDYEFTELTIFAMGGAMHREGVSDREPLRYGGEIAQYTGEPQRRWRRSQPRSRLCSAVSRSGLTYPFRSAWPDIRIRRVAALHTPTPVKLIHAIHRISRLREVESLTWSARSNVRMAT